MNALDYFYPEEEQRLFTNREHYLALLDLSRKLLTQGIRKHLVFNGFRRIGKTVILKEFLRRHWAEQKDSPVVVAYLDLPRLAFTPEAFAVQCIGSVLYWLEQPETARIESYFDPALQFMAVARYGSPALADYLLAFHQELQKERPNQHVLLEMAFNWPEVWAQTLNRYVMILLDEFPEILVLDNYVQEAFTLETLDPTGRIYTLCRYILEESLQRTRGKAIPQAILQVLAREVEGLSLTQLARRLKRPSGAIRQVLNWLVEVDLLEQREDRTYTFHDPVLHVWAAYYYAGLELTGTPRQKVLDQLVADRER